MSAQPEAPLPPAARRRVEQAHHAAVWSSQLTPGEDAALRSVGFAPVGVVTASVPSWPRAFRYPEALRRAASRTTAMNAAASVGYSGYGLIDDALTSKRAGGFTRDYVQGPYGGILPDTGYSWERVVRESTERQLVASVIDSMRTEAGALGAHGIVAIRLTHRRRTDLDVGEVEEYEVNGVGLGVRAEGADHRSELFTAALSAGEVTALLKSGLAPSQLAFGVGIVRADMGNRTRRKMRSLGAAEISQFSEAIAKSLSLATADLEHAAAPHGQVIAGCRPELTVERALAAGIEAHARIVGTALRQFTPPAESTNVLPILRLRDRPAPSSSRSRKAHHHTADRERPDA